MTTRLRARLLRYTTLPALLFMLRRRKLTLLSPSTWDDRNDAHYLDRYREERKLGAVLALCFTRASATFHHWQVFAEGGHGVCIELDRPKLLRALARAPIEIRSGDVRYLRERENRRPPTERLPFLKRWAFRDEVEYRVIACSRAALTHVDVDLPLECIVRVTLGPRIHASLADEIKGVIHGVEGCERLAVVHTRLLDNATWKRAARSDGRR